VSVVRWPQLMAPPLLPFSVLFLLHIALLLLLVPCSAQVPA